MNESRSKDNLKPIVIIKPIAYYKMLVHMLRFGSKTQARNKYKEVMGILIGHLDGEGDDIKNVIIEDAVPISHGGTIEVSFAPEDYVSFAAVDTQYAEKNWFSVGWYHSHPNLGIFFSATDINNQLGWQTPLNPSAVGIVFDHAYLEKPGDLGFRTFRLDDPSKGQTSRYHEVKTIVKSPNSLDYYFKLIDLIKSVYTKDPPILEINETPELFAEIDIPSESQIKVKKPALESKDIISILQNGLFLFLETTFEPLIKFLNTWSQEIITKIEKLNLQSRKDILDIKSLLTEEIKNLQNWFKLALREKLDQFDFYIDDKIEIFNNHYHSLEGSIKNFQEEFNENLDKLTESSIKPFSLQMSKISEDFSESLNNINEIENNLVNKLGMQQESLDKLSKNVISIEKSNEEKLQSVQENIFIKLTDIFKKMEKDLINIEKIRDKTSSEIESTLISLESAKKPIQIIIDTIKNENLNLKSNLKELEKKNQELMKKVKKLEKGGI